MHDQLTLWATLECRDCGEALPETAFHRNRSLPTGRAPYCRMCAGLRKKRYYAANPEPARQRARANYDRERNSAAARRSRHRNPARHRANVHRWRQNNPEAYLEQKRRNALRRRTGRDAETSAMLLVLAADPCAYCGGIADTFDHIEPVVSGGANHWSNLTPACRSCNSSKNTKPLLLFLATR